MEGILHRDAPMMPREDPKTTPLARNLGTMAPARKERYRLVGEA